MGFQPAFSLRPRVGREDGFWSARGEGPLVSSPWHRKWAIEGSYPSLARSVIINGQLRLGPGTPLRGITLELRDAAAWYEQESADLGLELVEEVMSVFTP